MEFELAQLQDFVDALYEAQPKAVKERMQNRGTHMESYTRDMQKSRTVASITLLLFGLLGLVAMFYAKFY